MEIYELPNNFKIMLNRIKELQNNRNLKVMKKMHKQNEKFNKDTEIIKEKNSCIEKICSQIFNTSTVMEVCKSC